MNRIATLLGLVAVVGLAAPVVAQEVGPQGSAKAARAAVQELVAGEFGKVTARFDNRMRTALPEARLAAVWRGLEAKAGEFERIRGVVVADHRTRVVLVCQFARADLDVTLTFDAAGRIAGMFFRPDDAAAREAPAYSREENFIETPVTVRTGRWKLPGTLTMPKGKGPFPGVVLVAGSGPEDQDETIGPNKPLKDIAWGLAERGLAVLRYAKRTYVYGAKSSSNPARLTIDDVTVDDARSAVALLARETRVDPHRVYVLGHSLGATMAPEIATGDEQVAGIILLAGAVTPIERLALEQTRVIDAREHVPAKAAEQRVAQAEAAIRQIESPSLKLGTTVDFLGRPMPASFWLSLRRYHPDRVAARLHTPMLLLQGGRDYQVPPSELALWKKALSGRKNVTYDVYPSLNHLFEAGTGPSTPSEYMKPGRHVDVQVIGEVATWVKTEARS
ncbi:MAG: alpha/beta fold hydrolase [Gemmatimonadetes bacterium]|nr:alpha/beta fold hydrolase [Gemmatimonadota bacterium]